MRLAMVIDSSRCINCKACTIACKTANQVPEGEWRNWIKSALPERPTQSTPQGSHSRGQFQPGGCMHCQEATCVNACPTGATKRDPRTNEITINQELCIGCGSCIKACPYDARYIHPTLHVADKCNYCLSRRAQADPLTGAAQIPPACVNTCLTKARAFGDLDDPTSDASRRLAEFNEKYVLVQNASTPTNPNMYYVKDTEPKNWPREAEYQASLNLMKNVARPLAQVLVGVVAVGVVAAFGRSLIWPDKEDMAGDAKHEDSKGDSHE